MGATNLETQRLSLLLTVSILRELERRRKIRDFRPTNTAEAVFEAKRQFGKATNGR